MGTSGTLALAREKPLFFSIKRLKSFSNLYPIIFSYSSIRLFIIEISKFKIESDNFINFLYLIEVLSSILFFEFNASASSRSCPQTCQFLSISKIVSSFFQNSRNNLLYSPKLIFSTCNFICIYGHERDARASGGIIYFLVFSHFFKASANVLELQRVWD